jgi:hypothetical protein
MAMPLVRRVKSLPVKLLARASVLPGNTIKQKCEFPKALYTIYPIKFETSSRQSFDLNWLG